MLVRPPSCAALAPWVDQVWASADPAGMPVVAGLRCERLLPSGQAHVVVRLVDAPLWIGEAGASSGTRIPAAALAGPRLRWTLRWSASLSCSVGAVLRPGAIPALFGLPATEAAGRHVDLADLAGSDASALVDRIRSRTDPTVRVALLESWLVRRLDSARVGVSPDLLRRVHRQIGVERIGVIARELHWSDRRLTEHWRAWAGLSPKQHQRLLRLQRVLSAARGPRPDWAAIAAMQGFSDQAHLCREFRDMTGLTPTDWGQRRSGGGLHLPDMAAPRSDFLQDGRRAAWSDPDHPSQRSSA